MLKGGYGGAKTDLTTGFDAANDAVRGGAGGALGALDAGYGDASAALTKDGGAWTNLASLGGDFRKGADLYGDAMGLNGAEGAARAKAAFQGGPAWQDTLDMGIDALNRSHNARGNLNSGNTDADAIKLGSTYANQGWQSYLAGLQPYNQLAAGALSTAAGGDATTRTTLANLAAQGGRDRAGVETQQGGSLADIANRYYGGMAGLDTGGATALSGNLNDATKSANSIAMGVAPQYTKTYSDEAAAATAGNKNIWDTLLGGANLGLKASGIGGFGGMNLANLGANPLVEGATYLKGGAGDRLVPTFGRG